MALPEGKACWLSCQALSEYQIAKDTRGRKLLDRKLMVLLYLIRDTQSVRAACGPSGTGSLLTRKGQVLLNAYEQFESAAKMNMEKLYDTYLRDLL